jgi:PIN domain nuclease of toxin-antitoxin system
LVHDARSDGPLALEAIAAAQRSGGILVSPLSAWETALAVLKPHSRPDLGGQDALRWFRNALRTPGVKLVRPGLRIAVEASNVSAIFGRGDPGDCFVIATARVRKVPIVTRDHHMQRLARAQPDYLRVISC